MGVWAHLFVSTQRRSWTHSVKLRSRVGTAKKRRRTIKERRDIVEETLVPGASVARVARRHDVNANQVFYWRKLYREGQLGIGTATPLAAGEDCDGATRRTGER